MVAAAVYPHAAPHVRPVGSNDRSKVRYHPRGASAELFRHHESECIIAGPAGTGKTYGALWRLHLAALKYPGMRGIMLRRIQEDLTASALVTYQERVLGSGNWGVRPFGGSKTKPAGFQYPNGSELMMGGLDKADKVMSRDYDLMYVNECWEISDDDWQKLTTRINRPGRVMPYNQVFGDTNPQGPGHWILKRAQRGVTTLLNSYHKDNPLLWDGNDWTEQGRVYLATLDNLTGHIRARLLDGLWTAAEGVVYPAFNRQTHVKPVDCTGWATIVGLDLGTRNPTCILRVRYSGDRIHIEREVYERGMSSDAITDAAIAEFDGSGADYLIVDPSAAGLIASLQARGIPVRKANNDVKGGISRVTSILPDLTVDPSCVNTIEEFETYRYPTGGSRDSNDTPVKENDHAMDVIRYVALQLAEPPVRIAIL